jgi:asparagine synthase (glutamine-hydrolysing)
VSTHGLELRVPFLDKDVIDFSLRLPPRLKAPYNGYEKMFVRESFVDGWLPIDILFRRKEGFSDGVSGQARPWYADIQSHVNKLISTSTWNEFKDEFLSKEALFYFQIFGELFPTYALVVPPWMPKWSDVTDPSGRLVNI